MDGVNEEFQIDGYSISVNVDEPFAAQVDGTGIAGAVAATLRFCTRDEGEVSVLVTNDESVQSLNRDYRGVDAPTDVLSFPAHDDPVAGAVAGAVSDPALFDLPDELAQELNRHLGDLVFALPYVTAQARRYETTVRSELRLLTVHGTLHLLGYDHGDAEEKAAMWTTQDAVLISLGEAPHEDRDYD